MPFSEGFIEELVDANNNDFPCINEDVSRDEAFEFLGQLIERNELSDSQRRYLVNIKEKMPQNFPIEQTRTGLRRVIDTIKLSQSPAIQYCLEKKYITLGGVGAYHREKLIAISHLIKENRAVEACVSTNSPTFTGIMRLGGVEAIADWAASLDEPVVRNGPGF